ncbi:MAG: Holliday junction branch migration protein RuvA [Bacteroidia bacterium]|nr:Holliday junction branch migration protein RuvA [Bacteroidia bacterium]MCC7533293.1 Holliday junction branch migration protein RuvA [Bacteroidia bacterium]MCZ2141588.1 Holliday junction branch migration protein RuvA [Bacteroidia bacterium]
MIAFVEGKLEVKTPTYLVVNCGGVGYSINISLNTYEQMSGLSSARVLTHMVVKEDSHTLFGFAEESERELFLHLLSVNGVGSNTARMILSSLKPLEIKQAITSGNWSLLKSVKGIGPKTAQRIVIDLQDKIQKAGIATGDLNTTITPQNKTMEEALAALLMLGFNKSEAEKGLQKIKQQNPDYSVEELIKHTLKVI